MNPLLQNILDTDLWHRRSDNPDTDAVISFWQFLLQMLDENKLTYTAAGRSAVEADIVEFETELLKRFGSKENLEEAVLLWRLRS